MTIRDVFEDLSASSDGKLYLWHYGMPHAIREYQSGLLQVIDKRTEEKDGFISLREARSMDLTQSLCWQVSGLFFDEIGDKFAVLNSQGMVALFSFSSETFNLRSAHKDHQSFLVNSLFLSLSSLFSVVVSCMQLLALNWNDQAFRAHTKTVRDFIFLSGGSLFATAGESSENECVCAVLFVVLFLLLICVIV
jgi:WD40 repeat protein